MIRKKRKEKKRKKKKEKLAKNRFLEDLTSLKLCLYCLLRCEARLKRSKKSKGGVGMDKIKERLIKFILKKVAENTTIDRPYYVIKWSGLTELARSQGYDILEIIDEMHQQGLIRKGLIPTKKKDKEGKTIKLLAIALPDRLLSRKAKEMLEEFENFNE